MEFLRAGAIVMRPLFSYIGTILTYMLVNYQINKAEKAPAGILGWVIDPALYIMVGWIGLIFVVSIERRGGSEVKHGECDLALECSKNVCPGLKGIFEYFVYIPLCVGLVSIVSKVVKFKFWMQGFSITWEEPLVTGATSL